MSPTYEYDCTYCGRIEITQKITDDALVTCPNCGESMKKIISSAGFILKGQGWPGKEIKGKK